MLDSAEGKIKCPKTPVTDPKDPRKSKTSQTGTKPACVWVPKPDYISGVGEPVEGTNGGHWYQKFCAFGDYKTLAEFQQALERFEVMNMQQAGMIERAGLEVQFFLTPPDAPRRTPKEVMDQEVVAKLIIPKTFIAVNPVPTAQVVGFPTWVWLTDENGKFDPKRYATQSKELTLEGYNLKWQVVPHIGLSPGWGESQTCDNAGVPWSESAEGDPAACTVTYGKSGKYTLTAEVAWTIEWWLEGDTQEDIPGPTNTATQALTVDEIHAVVR